MGKGESGFTLIELSIVLVIIGLVAGGVLVGQDLIRAAEVRATIAQIEKYNTAVNTFYGKFQSLPGDMNVSTATNFGFTVGAGCSGGAGERDGNGLIEGPWNDVALIGPLGQARGETGLFWQDLASVPGGNLIEGQYNGTTGNITCNNPTLPISGTLLSLYFPSAKLGNANYIYVYTASGSNWYGLSAISSLNTTR